MTISILKNFPVTSGFHEEGTNFAFFSSVGRLSQNTVFSGSPKVTERTGTLAPLSSSLQTLCLQKAEDPQAQSIYTEAI